MAHASNGQVRHRSAAECRDLCSTTESNLPRERVTRGKSTNSAYSRPRRCWQDFRTQAFAPNTIQSAFRSWFYPEHQAGAAATESVKATARGRIESGWNRVEAQIAAGGPYLVGDRVGAADFLATMLMRWSRNMPRPATEWPAIADYIARMKSRPSFKALYEREGLTEWA